MQGEFAMKLLSYPILPRPTPFSSAGVVG